MNQNKTMITKQILFLALCATVSISFGQSADKAKALLDEVYDKVGSYGNISIDFQSTLENSEANLKQETNGTLVLRGEKYLLNYMGAQQLYDGNKLYTIVPENEEVTIEDVAQGDDSLNPSKMLTFYRTGHNYQWDILQTVGRRKIQYVKLVPIDSKAEIQSILLGIDTQTKHIYKLIQTGSNGTKTTLTVNSFRTDQPLSSTLFTFNAKKYEDQGYYISRN